MTIPTPPRIKISSWLFAQKYPISYLGNPTAPISPSPRNVLFFFIFFKDIFLFKCHCFRWDERVTICTPCLSFNLTKGKLVFWCNSNMAVPGVTKPFYSTVFITKPGFPLFWLFVSLGDEVYAPTATSTPQWTPRKAKLEHFLASYSLDTLLILDLDFDYKMFISFICILTL